MPSGGERGWHAKLVGGTIPLVPPSTIGNMCVYEECI